MRRDVMMNIETSPIAAAASRLKEILGLTTDPVAVFLLRADADEAPFGAIEKVKAHRYCQLLMRARRGESLRLDPAELACPAAAAAFGLRPLTKGLATGKALAGFGIVSDPATGRAMFEGMPRLPAGGVCGIAACPLRAAPRMPEVIVVEGPPEPLMWLALADLNLAGGQRRRADTAVLQATCVDATVIPFLERRLNFSLGCYGCREATDLGPEETILGFPGASLHDLVAALEHLAGKAVGRSRSRAAFHNLRKRDEAHDESRPPAAGALPRLEQDVVVALSPEDVTRVFRAAMDGDRDEALAFVEERLYRSVKKAIESPRCLPAFEMSRKLKDGA
jgi:uncharacterized protein (DUF169 family)